MKDILIVAHFTQIPGEKGNGRFNYIANMLENAGHKVEIVTTNFSHDEKKHRKSIDNEANYKITMLKENGYKKNVSIKRIYSHYTFGKNLKNFLTRRKKPDLIYCAVPSLDASYNTAKYAKENGIRFIIDVQDIWPEAYKMVFNIPFISDLFFLPMTKRANYIYRSADHIIAVSETYVSRALAANHTCENPISVFLGTDLEYFDCLAKASKILKPENEIWIAYIGTLGHSYDLSTVIDALHILKRKGCSHLKFIIMGDGPLKEKFIDYANEKNVYCEFTGMLDYSQMVEILVRCDIAVNPITKGAAGSIINKVGDYAAAGLPVINTQECLEYQKLITDYHAGINCENNNSDELAENIQKLIQNEVNRKKIGENNRILAEEKFNRKKTYEKIITALLGE